MKTSRPSDAAPAAAPTAVAAAVDHLFRREAGRLVAILTRRFGPSHLHLAEDVVQDALAKAMHTWPYTGVPDNPTAWILQTARNRALDQLRRSKIWQGRQPELLPHVEDCLAAARRPPVAGFEDEIHDSQLRMMFVCCHPGLPPDAQVALTLKVLCGFGEREIAAAFLARPDAIAKRLTRARQFLREQNVGVELPDAAELAPRLGAVRQVLYLLFNEGHRASHGPELLRADLCAEAIRLGELLVAGPLGADPETHALLALLCLHAARLPARLGDTGMIATLAHQDRSRWDRSLIARGMDHLARSGGGVTVSRFHLEAGIAACHTLAPDDAATDWEGILDLYDDLLDLDRSPVVGLNRAVAVARVRGPRAGLAALDHLSDPESLGRYALLPAVRGQFLAEVGDTAGAAAAFRAALALTDVPAERDFLERRIAALGAKTGG